MKNISIYILLLLSIVSCKTNTNIQHYYYLPEEEAIDVGYPYGSMVYQGMREYSFKNVLITANILEFKQNAEFAVIKQQINDKLLRSWIRDGIYSYIHTKGYNGEKRGLQFYDVVLSDTLLLKYDESDSSVNYLANVVLKSPLIKKMKENSLNYWVLQKFENRLTGPLNKPEFNISCKELSIPDNLKLD